MFNLNNNLIKSFKKNNFKLIVLMILCIMTGLESCQKNEVISQTSINPEKVNETIEKFFKAYRDDDINTIVSIYPNVISLGGEFRKSSNIDFDINDIIIVNNNYIITDVTHHWINPYGADNVTCIKLHMIKVGDSYKIIDSKNFCIYDESKLYNYACKTGAIKSNLDTTDIAISQKMLNVTEMYDKAKDLIKNRISSGLKIENWKWETGYYNDYATGKAIVKNNSIFPIKAPKYIVTYLYNNNTITTDEGYVCYDVLMPEQSRSFSWYTSYVGYANKANIKVVCEDESWIEDIIDHLPFRGNEYNKYCDDIYWFPL